MPYTYNDHHIVDLREDGWTVQHPLSCRPHLLDCPVNKAAERDLIDPPAEPGRFTCGLDDDGRLEIGDRAEDALDQGGTQPKLIVPKGPPREPSRSTHALHDEPSDPGRNEDMTPHAGVIAMLADKVSAITSEHHLDPNTKDADDILLCACGAWVEDWDMHWAEVAITAMYPEIAKQVRALAQPGDQEGTP